MIGSVPGGVLLSDLAGNGLLLSVVSIKRLREGTGSVFSRGTGTVSTISGTAVVQDFGRRSSSGYASVALKVCSLCRNGAAGMAWCVHGVGGKTAVNLVLW